MRIGFDARLIGFSGAGVYTSNLLRSLSEVDSRNEYTVFTDRRTEAPVRALLRDRNPRVVRIDASPLTLRHHLSFFPVFLREHVDIYHYPHFDMPLVHGYPSVVTVYDIHPLSIPDYCSREKQYYFRLVVRLNLLRAKNVIVLSHHAKREIMEAFSVDPKKIVVIYAGVEERFSKDSRPGGVLVSKKLGLGKEFLLYVGNHKPHKNLSALLKAYARLDLTLRDRYDLVITGRMKKSDEYLERAVGELGLRNSVRFTGFVEDEDLPGLYESARAVVMPSLREGFGLPVLEAMACGTPVVAARRAALPEVGGKAACYFDPLDIDDMTDAISRVLQDEELRSRLSQMGRGRAAGFSWRDTARQTMDVYREVAGASLPS